MNYPEEGPVPSAVHQSWNDAHNDEPEHACHGYPPGECYCSHQSCGELEPYQREVLARMGKRLVLMTPRRDPLRRLAATLATFVARRSER